MRSETSVLRCLAVVSVSVGALLLVYKLGKDHHRMDSGQKAVQPRHRNIGLKEGQTIVGVSDTPKAMCFYISNDDMTREDDDD